MQIIKAILVVIQILLVSSDTFATEYADRVPEGISISINQDGLHELSKALEKTFSQKSEEIHVQKIEYAASPVVINLSNVSISYSISSLAIIPLSKGLAITTELDDIKLKIGSLSWGINAFGGQATQICDSIEFRIAEKKPLLFQSKIDAEVENEQIVLNSSSTSFPIDPNDYKVIGPAQCHGPVKELHQQVLNQIFQKSRSVIEIAIKQKIDQMVPEISDFLNTKANLALDLDISHLPFLNQSVISISTYPQSINISNKKLDIRLGVTFTSKNEQLSNRSEENSLLEHVASIGLSHEIFNQLLRAALTQGSSWFEIDESIVPNLRDYLATDKLSSIWPDLSSINLEEPFVRVKGQIQSYPKITTDPNSNDIVISDIRLLLKIMVKEQEQWVDYVYTQFLLSISVTVENKDAQLKFAPRFTEFTLNSYRPENDGSHEISFNKDIANNFFRTLLTNISINNARAYVLPPKIKFFGSNIKLDSVRLGHEFIYFDFKI